MAIIVEALFHVGPRRNLGDGEVLEFHERGELFTPVEFEDWFQTGTPPARLSNIPRTKAAEHHRYVKQLKFLDISTPAEVIVQRPTIVLEDATSRIQIAKQEIAFLRANGYDTNGGAKARFLYGSVLVQVDSLSEMRELLDEPFDETLHPMSLRLRLGARRVRVRYEDILSGRTLSDTRDPLVRVDLNRNAVPAVLADKIQDV